MSLPTLRTARLTLRPYHIDDVDPLHQLWTMPEVRRFLWDDIVIPRERAEETVRGVIDSIEGEGFGHWIISDDENPLMGFCGYTRREPTEDPELMYGLAPQYWGKGYATEAARAALEFGFGTLGFTRVLALTDTPNEASARVMQRLGMRFTHRGTLNGLDTVFYEILRDEFVGDEATETPRTLDHV